MATRRSDVRLLPTPAGARDLLRVALIIAAVFLVVLALALLSAYLYGV